MPYNPACVCVCTAVQQGEKSHFLSTGCDVDTDHVPPETRRRGKYRRKIKKKVTDDKDGLTALKTVNAEK